MQKNDAKRSSTLRVSLGRACVALATWLVTACETNSNGNGGNVAAPADDDDGNPTVSAESLARGGALYDKWWAVADLPEPSGDHPLWSTRPDTASNTRTGPDTWRCKECHGWDYQGVDGAYGEGSHRTGFPGVLGTTLSRQQLFDIIANDESTTAGGHGYSGAGLGENDINSLVDFLEAGLVSMDDLVDESGAFLGDVTRGETLYQDGIAGAISCSACHGADGLTPPPGAPADYDHFIGDVAGENPAEFQHKVRFGQPGTDMPAAVAEGGSLTDVRDLAAFSQTLPEGP